MIGEYTLMFSVLLSLLRLVLWPSMWCLLWKMSPVYLGGTGILLLLGELFCSCLLGPVGLKCCCLGILFPCYLLANCVHTESEY